MGGSENKKGMITLLGSYDWPADSQWKLKEQIYEDNADSYKTTRLS